MRMMTLRSSLKKNLCFHWRTLLRCCCASGRTPSIEPSILNQQFLPVLCVGSTSCKGYIIALHQLTSRTFLRILADTASDGGKASGTLTILCEPHTFEATFCLLERSFNGLIHIPHSHNGSIC